MTDGIIQEVFKKEKSKPRSKYFSRKEINPLLNRLQQELIEKIKQAFDNEEDKEVFNTTELLKRLIGDTTT